MLIVFITPIALRFRPDLKDRRFGWLPVVQPGRFGAPTVREGSLLRTSAQRSSPATPEYCDNMRRFSLALRHLMQEPY